MKTNLPSTTLLHRFQAFLATLLLGWLAVSAHAAQPRIVFHEIVNPGAGKLVHSLGSYPAMSGNGNLVVYSVSRPDSQLDLFAINTDGTGQHSLGLFPHNAYRPAISYNGALAVLWNNSNLYTLNTTFGTPVKVLTMNTPGVISSIAVNDDGTKFYFTISADDYIFNTLTLLQAGVWEMNPDGSGRRLVTGLNAIRATLGLSVTGYERVGVEGGLAVSFNNRIVFPFMSNFYTGMHHIMSVNADGTGLRAIGPLAYSPSSVTISRDGSKVAFDQYSPRDLNTVNWDGTGHVVQVVPAHAYDPLRLTDNGSHLALVDRILRSDGGGFRSLRSGTSGSILAVGSDAPYLQLSADGRKICSVKNFGNTSTLVMIELDPDNLLGAPDITNTAITPGFVVHNNGTQATVTAQATYSGTPNSAFVYANLFLNGLPDPIFYAPVGTLFDDATNGDAVAGNGLFTANNFHFGYPTTSFGPRVVRFVTENTINGLRHATMVDHEPFFVLAAAPSGSAPVITSIAPDPGTAGGIITINGSNFGITRTGNVVTLGGYSCYVLTANGAGTQLTAEVPRFFLDGSYSAVVSANGQSSAPFAFSIGTAVPEIAVEQPAGTGIADGGSKDFGSVNTGANTSLIFTIKNTGNANLTGLTITKDGAHSADFTVTANPTAPVSGPSGSTTFTVQFAPGDVGARTAVLHIANNDSNENPYDITLTGIGTSVAAPEIAVEQPAGTNIADGGSKDFGSVSSGSNASLVFTIKNTGNSNLTGLTITKDGTHSADFTVTANPTAPVTGPSGSTTFTVQFAPGGIGARTAALHIANNDGDENPFDITLTGTGTAAGTPEIVVEQPQNVILNDGVSTVAWGSVAPGAGVVKSFTVRNTGTGSLNLSDVTKDGPNAADFSIGTLAGSLAAGDSTSFSVSFNPSTLGVKSAVLHILSNDADENPFDINLTGI
ncbi:MAG: choice-of-anchor D domain-containing protein, partial [Prosthecobacter sp.]